MDTHLVISVKDLKVYCIIGCLPEEETHEQEIRFDIEVTPLHKERSKEDEIGDTISYLYLAEKAEEFAKRNNYRLIETLAHDLVDHFMEHLPIEAASVYVKKPTAVASAAYASCLITKYHD